MTSSAERHVETADTIEAIEECFRLGWTDGLPVVPPADYKVREMLSRAGLTGEEELLNLDMRSRVITSENAAANAVMAGCQSDYFPVLVTALRTLEEERNFVNMAASSTSSPSILMVLNGPIREALGINSRDGLFGPGFRANASIGRAVRLCFMNGFDAWPGQLDRGTLGTPAKYTFCIAENEEDSPWEPLHVSRGFQASDSVVTVAVAYNPVSVPNSYGHTGRSILLGICDTLQFNGSRPPVPRPVGHRHRAGTCAYPAGRRLDTPGHTGVSHRKQRTLAGRAGSTGFQAGTRTTRRRPADHALRQRPQRHPDYARRRHRRTLQRHHRHYRLPHPHPNHQLGRRLIGIRKTLDQHALSNASHTTNQQCQLHRPNREVENDHC